MERVIVRAVACRLQKASAREGEMPARFVRDRWRGEGARRQYLNCPVRPSAYDRSERERKEAEAKGVFVCRVARAVCCRAGVMPGFCRGIAARGRRGLRGESGLDGGLDPRVGKYLAMALVVLYYPVWRLSGEVHELGQDRTSRRIERGEGLGMASHNSRFFFDEGRQRGFSKTRDTSDNVCK